MSATLSVSLSVLLALALTSTSPALAASPARHWRLDTAHGPVHVWRPAGYRARTAAIAVYVHGFYTSADQAWSRHKLAAQFQAGRRNALFIVPEAPDSAVEQPAWLSLTEFLETVHRLGRIDLPPGPVVAVGHSGAYRTIAGWLSEPRLTQVVLVDALYGNEDEFRAWLEAGDERTARRMILVARGTLERSEAFAGQFADAVVLASVPHRVGRSVARHQGAHLVLVRSQFGHMELITEQQALPVLLQMCVLPPL